MGYALQGSVGNPGDTVAKNQTLYFDLSQSYLQTSTSETESRITCRKAGTLKLFQVKVNTNGISSDTTVRSRLNGANGALSVTIPASTTGLFQDLTNTETLASGDTYNGQMVIPNSGTTIEFGAITVAFTATTNHVVIFGTAQQSTVSAGAQNLYIQLTGSPGFTTTENNHKEQIDVAGIFSRLQLYVSGNGRSTTSRLRLRKNNADGTLTFTIGAATTGFFEDTTHTDSVVAGDDVCFELSTSTGTGSITVALASVIFTNSVDSKNNIYASGYAGGGPLTRSASATPSFYYPMGAQKTNNTTEAKTKIQRGFGVTNSKMKIFISANTYSVSATMTSRKNGAAGSQTITITNGVTGLFEDTTNSDTLASTDDFCYSIVGGTSGSITIQWMGSLDNSAATALFGSSLFMRQAVKRAAFY